jgi:hypothetical protein
MKKLDPFFQFRAIKKHLSTFDAVPDLRGRNLSRKKAEPEAAKRKAPIEPAEEVS